MAWIAVNAMRNLVRREMHATAKNNVAAPQYVEWSNKIRFMEDIVIGFVPHDIPAIPIKALASSRQHRAPAKLVDSLLSPRARKQ